MKTKLGRNEPCHCGSGKKYKNCHMEQDSHSKSRNLTWLYVLLFIALVAIAGIFTFINSKESGAGGPGEGKVWSEEHQHYH